MVGESRPIKVLRNIIYCLLVFLPPYDKHLANDHALLNGRKHAGTNGNVNQRGLRYIAAQTGPIYFASL